MHPLGFQLLILALNSDNVCESLILLGRVDQIWGPLNEIVSVPLYTDFTLTV